MATAVMEPPGRESARSWMNGWTLEYLQGHKNEVAKNTADVLPHLMSSIAPGSAPFDAANAVDYLTRFVAQTDVAVADVNTNDEGSRFRKLCRDLTGVKFPNKADSKLFGDLLDKLFYLHIDEDKTNPLMPVRNAIYLVNALSERYSDLDENKRKPALAAAIGHIFNRIDDAIEKSAIYASWENMYKQQAVNMVAAILYKNGITRRFDGAEDPLDAALKKYAAEIGQTHAPVIPESPAARVMHQKAESVPEAPKDDFSFTEVVKQMPDKYKEMMGRNRFGIFFADQSRSTKYKYGIGETQFTTHDNKNISRKIVDEEWFTRSGEKSGRKIIIDKNSADGVESITCTFEDKEYRVSTSWGKGQFTQEIFADSPVGISTLVETVPQLYPDGDGQVPDQYKELKKAGYTNVLFHESITYLGEDRQADHFVKMEGLRHVDDIQKIAGGMNLSWSARYLYTDIVIIDNGIVDAQKIAQPGI